MAADIQIIMEVLGEQDVLKATKATDKLEKEVGQLNTAFRRGKISQADYVRGLNQLSSKNKQLGGGYNNLQKAVFSYASSIDQAQRENNGFVASQARVNTALKQGQNQYAAYNTETYRANQRTKRFASVGLQQAGYQVGDFAVQVQSGTNVAVAFGQQMSQLLGIFGAFGAVAGAVVAVVTAIVAPLIDARNRTEELTDATEDLSSAFDTLEQTDVLNYYNQVSEGVDKVIDKYRALLESVEAVAQEQRAEGLSGIVTELAPQSEIQDTLNKIEYLQAQVGKMGVDQEKLNLEIQKEQDLLENQRATREAILSIQGETRLETAANLELAIKSLQAEGAYTDELRNQLVEFAEKNGLVIEINKEIEKEKDLAKEVTSQTQRFIDLLSDGPSAWKDINSVIDQSISKVEKLVRISSRFFSQAQAIGGIRSMDLAGQYAQYGRGRQAAEKLMAEFRYSVNQQFPDYSPPEEDSAGSMRQATQEANKFTEALNKMSGTAVELGKTMKDSVGGALMSIVDGTKDASDAFRDMARQILKKAFDLLVIQPLMNSLFGVSGGGGLFGLGGQGAQVVGIQSQLMAGLANGGALHNGRLMAFANGGVVDSPTLFPMANGAGLMGEAGPEAIMPLKRGKDGKLGVAAEGGNQPVNVTQQFIIQGNGDDYIMNKIKQAAPSIAQATKASIINDRQRGGNMKQVFSG